MSSTFYPTRRRHSGPARRWLIGGGAAVAVGAALVSMVVAQPRAVVPQSVVTQSPPAVPPIGAYAVEGLQGNEWWVRSATDGYAIVDGQVMVRVSSGDSADATSRLVAVEDGYYDEGLQGYYWRVRPGR